MQLKSVFETQNDQEYKDILKNLREKYGRGNYGALYVGDICEGSCSVENRYGTKVYSGKLKDGIDITPLELSMMCDNGFSYFGGSSSISEKRNFRVEIWID